MKHIPAFLILVISFCNSLNAQHLKPGFDKDEYLDLMKVSSQFGDSGYAAKLPPPPEYKLLYQSPVMGLENMWDLWMNENGVAVISIRGTTANMISWLGNFYAAMVPAKGSLELSKTENFEYELADNPKAAVHVGWLLCTGYLSKTILPKIDSLYKKGTREIIIMGHSQGGGIAYLLTAYLYHLQKKQSLPQDIRFKTYCSAGPKPGNLYFAYDYESITQAGWAYNVVNAADWVPETPFSIQTLDDFNELNPFKNAKPLIRKVKWPARWALLHAYNRMDKTTRKAARKYLKYLGTFISKPVGKHLKEFDAPVYAGTMAYTRAGNYIALIPDEAYYQRFPEDKKNVFSNHFHPPYMYLAEKLDLQNNNNIKTAKSPNGNWELRFIANEAVEKIFPEKRPFINIDIKKASGNTGCNSFNGTVTIDGNNIQFAEAMAMTRMMCQGTGEQTFLQALKKITSWKMDENGLLVLSADNSVIMKLAKK